MDLEDPTVLIGRWQLARVIEDHRAGETSNLSGTLELSETPFGLAWEEQLTWHRAEGDVAAERHLRVVRTDDGWWVRFEDGRDFHPWRPGEQVVHECAPDTYRGTVTGTTQEWTVVWEATGPAKDYRIRTMLTRP